MKDFNSSFQESTVKKSNSKYAEKMNLFLENVNNQPSPLIASLTNIILRNQNQLENQENKLFPESQNESKILNNLEPQNIQEETAQSPTFMNKVFENSSGLNLMNNYQQTGNANNLTFTNIDSSYLNKASVKNLSFNEDVNQSMIMDKKDKENAFLKIGKFLGASQMQIIHSLESFPLDISENMIGYIRPGNSSHNTNNSHFQNSNSFGNEVFQNNSKSFSQEKIIDLSNSNKILESKKTPNQNLLGTLENKNDQENSLFQSKSSDLDNFLKVQFTNVSKALMHHGYSLEFRVMLKENKYQIEYYISSDLSSKQFWLKLILDGESWMQALRFAELRLISIIATSYFNQLLIKSDILNNQNDLNEFFDQYCAKKGVKVVNSLIINNLSLELDNPASDLLTKYSDDFSKNKFIKILRNLFKIEIRQNIEIYIEDDEDESEEELETSAKSEFTIILLSQNVKIYRLICEAKTEISAKSVCCLAYLIASLPDFLRIFLNK